MKLAHPEYKALADTGTLRRITPLAEPATQQGNLYRCGDRAWSINVTQARLPHERRSCIARYGKQKGIEVSLTCVEILRTGNDWATIETWMTPEAEARAVREKAAYKRGCC